jgi:hypothetical protein
MLGSRSGSASGARAPPGDTSSFYCPITAEIMRDPVVDREGNSYERSAIIAWLAKNPKSPVTLRPLTVDELVPNTELKAAIDATFPGGHVATAAVPPVPRASADEPTGADDMATYDEPVLSVVRQVRPISETENECTYLVTVDPRESGNITRHPATICCVVDTSGSMSTDASVQGVESTGLSMLDIVKHALRTIITTLGSRDRLALVSFSSQGKIQFELMNMNEHGKKFALEKVAALRSGGSTNLWDGLYKGMQLLDAAGECKCPIMFVLPPFIFAIAVGNSALYLLTDGVPSEVPPRGHIPMMQKFRDEHGGRYPGCINTFGFGYSLQR